MTTKKRQLLINLENSTDYYNFFNTPESQGSLKRHLNNGYVVIYMELDKVMKVGWVLLEKDMS